MVGTPSPPPATPFLYLATAAVLALVFGDFSQDLAGWIVCATASGRCSDDSQTQAQTIAVMVSTFLAVYLAAQAGLAGSKTATEARLLVVGAMAGALFAVLKAAEGKLGYPDPEALFEPLLVWSMALAVFLVPMWQAPPGDGHQLLKVYHRVALAFLVAACLGGLLQFTAHHLWTVGQDNGSSRKFVVAPVAPVIGGAVFGALMLQGREAGRPLGTVIVWLLVAVATVSVWTWHQDLPRARVAAAYGLLILVGVLMMAALAVTDEPLRPTLPTLAVVGAACLAAAALGADLGLFRAGERLLGWGQVPVLALVHAFGPPCAWLSVWAATRLQARLAPAKVTPQRNRAARR